jgi:hypothetical protein
MKNQKLIPCKGRVILQIATCLYISAAMLTGCETSGDEVLPQDPQVHANESFAQEKESKNLPHKELARLRAATARYHKIENALADGYDFDLTGYRSQMGHHYLKLSLLDGSFELERPEVIMYVQGPNDRWRFVGVEYAVPIQDMNNIPPPPAGFTGDADVWAVNYEFDVWTLHVWVGLNNPNGIFAAHNPRLP